MRKLVLLILLFPMYLIAQDSIIAYSKVVDAPSATKTELYTKARQWINERFVSSNDVLQISDKESGELAGKGIGSIKVTYKMMGTRTYDSKCRFFINIYLKDGKYKYVVSNFQTNVADTEKGRLSVLTSAINCPDRWDMTSQTKMNEIWASAKSGAIAMAKDLGANLEAYINKQSAVTDF